MPLAGNGIRFLQARHKLFAWFAQCERLFGHETFQIAVPTLPPGVVINDPRNLEYVFRHESTFGKGEFVKGMLRDLFGGDPVPPSFLAAAVARKSQADRRALRCDR